MTVKIGPYLLPSKVLLAPMAGVTDRPFRILCRRFGAGLAASEMLSADVRLWNTPKSRLRMDHTGEPSPRVVQIAGFDPSMMADAARRFELVANAKGPQSADGELSFYGLLTFDGQLSLSVLASNLAVFDSSGIMTFIVGPDGDVYQKDLGPETARTAAQMTTFDPDLSWSRVDMTND